MTGINHALAGAVVATSIGQPVVAVPVAFTSHFLLDMLPHFGEPDQKRTYLSKIVWAFDVILVIWLYYYFINNKFWLAMAGAMAAMSPDIAWIYRYTISEKFGSLPRLPRNKFNEWHASIQKLEFRYGFLIEIPMILFLLILLDKFL